ncbi:MAG TPA: DUF1206 domain-containing protein [Marmoricola sp.]|nr:DUF1206 domain-containing protein [Marmoricola sp.]
MAQSAEQLGQQARHSDALDHAIRVGFLAYGLVHLVVAWLAVQLALGSSAGKVSSKGALHQLAQQPLGRVVLLVVAGGLFVLVLWRLLDAWVGHRDEDGVELWRHRGLDVLKAAVYGAVGVSAVQVVLGAGSGGSGTKSWTARLMDLPAGQALVGVAGLCVVAYGGSQLWKGLSGKLRDKLSAEGSTGEIGRLYLLLGRAGYSAKGIAAALVGVLVCYAAITHDAGKSGGLDQALHEVLRQPFGSPLLVAMAVGIACYGLFCFARARHLSR